MLQKWIKRFRSFDTAAIHRMLWLSLALLALGVFVMLTWELREDDDVSEFDVSVLRWVESVRLQTLNGAAVDVTAMGSGTLVSFFSIAGIIVLLLTKDVIGALHLALSSAGAGVWTALFKVVIGRERPTMISKLVEVDGFSYPSGHSLSAAAIFLTIAVLTSRHFPRVLQRFVIFGLSSIVILSVALSRVYLGVHYPSDVLSGVLFGTAWSLFLASVFSSKYWKARSV